MDEDRLGALVTAATRTAEGMGKVAGDKPDETPLKSDAHTFRGIARMLNSLSSEARTTSDTCLQLRRVLQRIAMLEVRGATQLIERGDWKKVVSELQAIAQDALAGGGQPGGTRNR